LAFTLAATEEGEEDLQVLMNMSDQPQTFLLQAPTGRSWHLALDTARPTLQDIVAREEQEIWARDHFSVAARSLVVLESR
jgi:pullulanase/glycogen debranching enzyme